MIITALVLAIIISGTLIWLFAPSGKEDDLSMFAPAIKPRDTGVLPVVHYSSTNPLACDQCDFTGKSVAGLKTHITRMHKV